MLEQQVQINIIHILSLLTQHVTKIKLASKTKIVKSNLYYNN